MFVLDAGYDPIAIGAALTDTAAQVLVRIRGDRVFYTHPNHRPAGTPRRPRRHRTRFALSDPASAPAATAELSVQDKRHGSRTGKQLDRPTPQTRMPRPLGRH
jgi:hypothetical protein